MFLRRTANSIKTPKRRFWAKLDASQSRISEPLIKKNGGFGKWELRTTVILWSLTVCVVVPVGKGGQLAVQDFVFARSASFPRAPWTTWGYKPPVVNVTSAVVFVNEETATVSSVAAALYGEEVPLLGLHISPRRVCQFIHRKPV